MLSANVGFLPKPLELELKLTSQIQGFSSLETMISLSADSTEPMGCSSVTPQVSLTTTDLQRGWDGGEERGSAGKK